MNDNVSALELWLNEQGLTWDDVRLHELYEQARNMKEMTVSDLALQLRAGVTGLRDEEVKQAVRDMTPEGLESYKQILRKTFALAA